MSSNSLPAFLVLKSEEQKNTAHRNGIYNKLSKIQDIIKVCQVQKINNHHMLNVSTLILANGKNSKVKQETMFS